MGVKDKHVYISGPMTGLPDFNRKAFDEAEERIIAAGASYVCNPSHLGDPSRTHEYHMTKDLHELTWMDSTKTFYDAIVLLPGWESSNGASLEVLVAIACGMEVIHLD